MNFLELQDTLQNLTNQKIFLADFAKILDCGKANISKRAKNNSEITPKNRKILWSFHIQT